MADSVTFEIEKKLGVLSKSEKGWKKEVNLVSWNNGITKLDIREWDADNNKMRKGVTLTRSEVHTLFGIIKHFDFNEIGDYSPVKNDKSSASAPSGKNIQNPPEDSVLSEEFIFSKVSEDSDVPFEEAPAESSSDDF